MIRPALDAIPLELSTQIVKIVVQECQDDMKDPELLVPWRRSVGTIVGLTSVNYAFRNIMHTLYTELYQELDSEQMNLFRFGASGGMGLFSLREALGRYEANKNFHMEIAARLQILNTETRDNQVLFFIDCFKYLSPLMLQYSSSMTFAKVIRTIGSKHYSGEACFLPLFSRVHENEGSGILWWRARTLDGHPLPYRRRFQLVRNVPTHGCWLYWKRAHEPGFFSLHWSTEHIARGPKAWILCPALTMAWTPAGSRIDLDLGNDRANLQQIFARWR